MKLIRKISKNVQDTKKNKTGWWKDGIEQYKKKIDVNLCTYSAEQGYRIEQCATLYLKATHRPKALQEARKTLIDMKKQHRFP